MSSFLFPPPPLTLTHASLCLSLHLSLDLQAMGDSNSPFAIVARSRPPVEWGPADAGVEPPPGWGVGAAAPLPPLRKPTTAATSAGRVRSTPVPTDGASAYNAAAAPGGAMARRASGPAAPRSRSGPSGVRKPAGGAAGRTASAPTAGESSPVLPTAPKRARGGGGAGSPTKPPSGAAAAARARAASGADASSGPADAAAAAQMSVDAALIAHLRATASTTLAPASRAAVKDAFYRLSRNTDATARGALESVVHASALSSTARTADAVVAAMLFGRAGNGLPEVASHAHHQQMMVGCAC